ncbi:rhodanese-like domain-containing protein [Prolixibacteraceae bacterium Z1-6]|uniref:Rhodanese-like domain-containing protein n=1 Tax=Draconibacterium aestuarii TaxID=2998507 RepID=A0A9X3F5W4_9BACT|nr:rhodanese-like domain-containing protein [Prolixibacteraceae bacterium Z1-6]
MNKNYIILTILMLVLAVGTIFLNREEEPKQIEPSKLLQEIIQPTRYVTTDQVAKMIIKGDPGLMLVDVRSNSEFEEFSLPNSVNIPLDSLLTGDNLSYFGIPGTQVVFISDDAIKADQCWVLTKRLGLNSTYVMLGGLNKWMETIIDPQQPSDDEPYTVHETYSFRKGAQMYFTGAEAEVGGSKVKVEVRRKEKTTVAAGGC